MVNNIRTPDNAVVTITLYKADPFYTEYAFGIEANQFAGHVETGHLLAAVLRHDGALQEAEADGIQGLEAVARAEQRITALDLLARRDQFFQLFDVFQR